MSANFTWAVVQMSSYPTYESQTDVVFQVNWSCTANEVVNGVTYTASANNVANVAYTAGTPFTPYNQLTQDQVLSWVYASGVDKVGYEAGLQQQIDNQINPPVVTLPLPWPQPPVSA